MNDNNVLIALDDVDVNDVDDAFDEWRAPGLKRGTKRIFWRRKVSLHQRHHLSPHCDDADDDDDDDDEDYDDEDDDDD